MTNYLKKKIYIGGHLDGQVREMENFEWDITPSDDLSSGYKNSLFEDRGGNVKVAIVACVFEDVNYPSVIQGVNSFLLSIKDEFSLLAGIRND